MGAGIVRHPLLMGAPAQLGRLHALGNEALDRPGVDEDARRLGVFRTLRVALGDVDALDADLLHEPGPFLAGGRLRHVEAHVGGDVQQSLLGQPGGHAGIGAAAGNGRGRARRAGALGGKRHLAQRVVGALARTLRLVEIEAEPGLVDRVDVECAEAGAELHDVARTGVAGEVDAEALATARGQQRLQHGLVVLERHGFLDEADAAFVQQSAVVVIGCDHHEPALVEFQMPLDQRQCPAADRTEADHHDRATDLAVYGPIRHSFSLLGGLVEGKRTLVWGGLSGVNAGKLTPCRG